jgi:hypothetical protein
MQLARYFRGSIRTMTRLDRVLVLLVVSLLSLQLLVSGHHKDDHVDVSADCPSCVFAHQVPHGLPDVEPVVVPVTRAWSYLLERIVVHQPAAYSRFLIPHSQAPPRA